MPDDIASNWKMVGPAEEKVMWSSESVCGSYLWRHIKMPSRTFAASSAIIEL